MKRKRLTILKRSSYFGVSLAFFAYSMQPAFVFADGSTPPTDPSTSTTTTDPSTQSTSSNTNTGTSNSGPQKPNGADAYTYHFNTTTGLWQNDHYTWDPTTHQTSPLTPPIYTCNPNTGAWDYSKWVWNATTGQYELDNFSTVTPPVGAQTVPCPVISPSNTSNTNSPNTSLGPDSNNSTNSTANNDTNLNNLSNVTVGSQLNQGALTGDASVVANTLGGNATSGNAADIANIMNLLQSTSSLAGPGVKTFVANVPGTVNGNLIIDPSVIQPATSQSSVTNSNSNTTVNNQLNGTINNDINLNAQTGNAKVADNTTGGNATSGAADAVANVVNMINSTVSSGQSFLGVINILGNLNGNILVPRQLLDSLMASNAPQTTLNTSDITNSNILNQFNNTNNQAINNNVNTTANTGTATVADNTSAGNATTGNASTNVTIFNLTGQQVVGANSMLVFVNVLGKWVGLIMNAPAGATAAELGGGITQNNTNANTTVNNTNNEAINNNINVNSQSGNASVDSNTTGGNAKSGDANSGVNLLNVTNSQMNLSGWFGILFINVFGTWMGNFSTYDPTTTAPSGAGPSTAGSSTTAPPPVQAFRFVPTNDHKFTLASASVTPPTQTQVLGNHIAPVHFIQSAKNRPVNHFDLFPILVVVFSVICFAVAELISRRNRRETNQLVISPST